MNDVAFHELIALAQANPQPIPFGTFLNLMAIGPGRKLAEQLRERIAERIRRGELPEGF